MIIIKRALRHINRIMSNNIDKHNLLQVINDIYSKTTFHNIDKNHGIWSNLKRVKTIHDKGLIERLIKACWMPCYKTSIVSNVKFNHKEYRVILTSLDQNRTYCDYEFDTGYNHVYDSSRFYKRTEFCHIGKITNLLILKIPFTPNYKNFPNHILDQIINNSNLVRHITHCMFVLRTLCNDNMLVDDLLQIIFCIMLELL